MKPGLRSFSTLLVLLLAGALTAMPAQQTGKPSVAPKKTAPPLPATAPKPTPTQPPTPAELIVQGKALYRSAKYKPALAKFEEALKQAPEHDEGLGLAAITAYRLDLQTQARDYFLKRAQLPKQKESVKAFCYYRASLSYWRIVHDLVAKYCEYRDDRFVAVIPDKDELDVRYGIDNGLDYIDRALSISKNLAEAYNIRNLLHSEAALVAPTPEKAEEERAKANEALRKAIELTKPAATMDKADFTAPTLRVAEIPTKKEDEGKYQDLAMKLVEGARPIKRVQPVFPSTRTPRSGKDPNDPSATGVTSDGGAYSLGSGRGALTAAYAPGKVKIEVLISTTGEVVFTHVVDGRSDLRGVAVLSARSWKFEPARFEGKPVQVSGVISFNLKPGSGQ
ncbi:MAG: energy transducer TonB [Blastocatellia bacterium]|nr:energy transducer TonB [Blastocatellia bacterium]